MEAKFKVVMKKDTEVMRDFISFTYRAQRSSGRYKLFVLAAGLLVISYLASRDGNVTAGFVIGMVGILMIVMGLLLPKIAVARLKKADLAYRNQIELTYVFGSGAMYVYENGELFQNVGGYSHISCFYGDEKNYYVGVNNDDLYLLPKKCFVEGNEEEFIDFIQEKSNEQYEFLPLTLKNKWFKYRVDAKIREAEYNQKAAELRAKDKEKKAQKKKNKK